MFPPLQVSVAVGCAARDRNVVFASTFATFFTRAYDQLRMAAISESNVNLCGSHCGVSIGQSLPPSLEEAELGPSPGVASASLSFPGAGGTLLSVESMVLKVKRFLPDLLTSSSVAHLHLHSWLPALLFLPLPVSVCHGDDDRAP